MKKDTKILIRFIVLMVITMAAGGITGYFSSVNQLSISEILASFMNTITYISPVFILLSALLTVWAYMDYLKDKKSAAVPESTLEKLCYSVILACTAFGAMVSGFAGLYNTGDVIYVALSSVLFFAVIFAAVFIQRAVIKQIKALNAENKIVMPDIFFYTNQFSARNDTIHQRTDQAAYMACRAVIKAVIAVFVVLVAVSLVYPLGPLPVILTGTIWFTQTYAYIKAVQKNN